MGKFILACIEIFCNSVSVMVILTRLLNYPIRKGKVKYGISVLALSIGLFAVYKDSAQAYYGFYYMGMIIVLAMSWIKETIGKRIVITITIMISVTAIEIIFGSILKILEMTPIANNFISDLLAGLTLIILMLFYIILSSKIRKMTRGERYYLPMYYYVIMLFFMLADIFAVGFITIQLQQSDKITFMVSLIIMYIGMLLQIVIMVVSVISKYRYRELSLSNARSLKMQEKHYQRLRKMDEDTRRFRHDMKTHLKAIAVLLEQDKRKDVYEYMEGLEAKLTEGNYPIHMNNDIVDAIVNEVYQDAMEKKIYFHVIGKMPPECQIASIDLCTIFSNLLTNAIEACEQVDGEREISLEIRTYQDEIYILQSNTKSEKVKKPDKRTSKPDTRNHGFGMGNIRESVEKYHGKVQINEEANRFRLSVTLPNKKI